MFRVGVSLHADTVSEDAFEDHYEVLQLSPKADEDAIGKMYRAMAARYHPDNPQTGDAEMFRRVVRAHDVLGDPKRRSMYDFERRSLGSAKRLASEPAMLQEDTRGEKQRRVAVLKVLYTARQQDPSTGAVRLKDLEEAIGCYRDKLEFALWYLKERQLITAIDSARYQITAAGVDEVERADEAKQLPHPGVSLGSEQRR
jgi:curved DNA-binding protein CbpA